ncbi:hypothetical protein TNCV_4511441 [Trichonephila clavipes]|nr:hypothetical protein TNCV_4511441 [Trichonephila clavipes]
MRLYRPTFPHKNATNYALISKQPSQGNAPVIKKKSWKSRERAGAGYCLYEYWTTCYVMSTFKGKLLDLHLCRDPEPTLRRGPEPQEVLRRSWL